MVLKQLSSKSRCSGMFSAPPKYNYSNTTVFCSLRCIQKRQMDSFWSESSPPVSHNTAYIPSQVCVFSRAAPLGALPLVCGPGWRTRRRDCTLRCRTWTDESGCTAAPLGWSSHSRAAETKADVWKRWIPKQHSLLSWKDAKAVKSSLFRCDLWRLWH